MPTARDLLPRDMKAFLPDVALFDVLARRQEYDFKVRLAGDGMRRVFGSVARKWLSEFLAPEVEKPWRASFEAVCARRARVRNHGTVSFKESQWLDFEALVAPLGQGVVVTDLFVVFVTWPRNDLFASPQNQAGRPRAQRVPYSA